MATSETKGFKLPVISFFQEVVAELKKVTWPTRNETIRLTVIVVTISIVVGLYIGALDTIFLTISGLIFKK